MCFCSGTASMTSLQWVEKDLLKSTTISLVQKLGQQAVILKLLAERQAKLLRQRFCIPQAPNARPLVLSNKHMLSTGQSLPFIVHPALPICILGYKNHPVPGSVEV